MFRTVINEIGNDYKVKISNGEEVKLPLSRLYVICGQEHSIPYLLRDDSLEKKKLENDIESNPGPGKYCFHCGKGIDRGVVMATHLMNKHYQTVVWAQML